MDAIPTPGRCAGPVAPPIIDAMRFWRLNAVTATVAALLFAATACTAGSSNGPDGGPAAGPPSQGTAADTTAVWRAFVSCARANGIAAWPDPVVDANTGQATFPQSADFNPKESFDLVRDACGRELDPLPPQANPLARPVVSPSEIALKLQYSQCMRENGVPEWRDPGADGYYDGRGIPGYNTDPAVTARMNAARVICDPILGR